MVDRDKLSEMSSFTGRVRKLEEKDLISVKQILEIWIRDRDTKEPLPNEVNGYLELMKNSLKGKGATYFVAEEDSDKVIGVIGMRKPKVELLAFAHTSNPVEFINIYVARERRGGKGVGRALVSKLEEEAMGQGFTEVVLDSGPRYEKTGWGFINKLFGKSVGAMKNYYPKGNALVWRKKL